MTARFGTFTAVFPNFYDAKKCFAWCCRKISQFNLAGLNESTTDRSCRTVGRCRPSTDLLIQLNYLKVRLMTPPGKAQSLLRDSIRRVPKTSTDTFRDALCLYATVLECLIVVVYYSHPTWFERVHEGRDFYLNCRGTREQCLIAPNRTRQKNFFLLSLLKIERSLKQYQPRSNTQTQHYANITYFGVSESA